MRFTKVVKLHFLEYQLPILSKHRAEVLQKSVPHPCQPQSTLFLDMTVDSEYGSISFQLLADTERPDWSIVAPALTDYSGILVSA